MLDQVVEVGKKITQRFEKSIIACRIFREQLPRKEIPHATRAVRKYAAFAIIFRCERNCREEMTWMTKVLAKCVSSVAFHILAKIIPYISQLLDNLVGTGEVSSQKNKQTFWKKYERSLRDEGKESR